jgi:hypothetical protein
VTPRFHPVDAPPHEADADLARTLLNGLERPDPRLKPWGALASLAAAFLSLGALPVLLWHDRFRDFVDDERHHLRRFGDWLRLHSTRPETMDLRVAGEDLGCRPLLSALSILSVVAVVVLFAGQLVEGRSLVEQVLAHTYHFDTSRPFGLPPSDAHRLFAAWCIGLSAAYLFHWVQVQAHASDVRRFVRYANQVLRAHGLSRVPTPRAGLGLGFLWLVGAALLTTQGAWWGPALALSGAAQQRYMREESGRVRRALAARVREMARLPDAAERAATPVPATAPTRRCPHVRCLAVLPGGARFCPRCGHDVNPGPARDEPLTVTLKRNGSAGQDREG